MKKEKKNFIIFDTKRKFKREEHSKTKNEKGITLISLALTITVLSIILSIGTYTGIQNVKESRESTRKSELYIVQQAALQKYIKYKLTGDEDLLQGEAYTDFVELNSLISEIQDKIEVTIKLKDDNAKNYYLLDKTSLVKIGITNTEDEYIVNYTTGEVLNKTRLVNTESQEPLYIYSKTSE